MPCIVAFSNPATSGVVVLAALDSALAKVATLKLRSLPDFVQASESRFAQTLATLCGATTLKHALRSTRTMKYQLHIQRYRSIDHSLKMNRLNHFSLCTSPRFADLASARLSILPPANCQRSSTGTLTTSRTSTSVTSKAPSSKRRSSMPGKRIVKPRNCSSLPCSLMSGPCGPPQ